MVILLRVLLFAAIIFAIYTAVKYLFHPIRKLELAYERKEFYFMDDRENVRRNFHLTYKGVLFEGEKYLGTTADSFEVVSIFIWTHSEASLNGLNKEDFFFLESKVLEHYPHAVIDWKSPIKEFLKN
ncbi:sigma-w pathway protein ysdB [Bacillus lacus]|uniref:Sigma-w pathway protein ysdB n=1 Tax=Metabacillus lacus TaxID=1983721 RepID=A0A7X2IYG0_9BACI|nr:sigma-w pathway protein ysdB [Metabacillus lacus]